MSWFERPGFRNFLFRRVTLLGIMFVLFLAFLCYTMTMFYDGFVGVFGLIESGIIGASIFLTLNIPFYGLGWRRMFDLKIDRPENMVLDCFICSILGALIYRGITSIPMLVELAGTLPMWLRLIIEGTYLVVFVIPVLWSIGARHYERGGALYLLSEES